jgi:hypothetical protein
MDFSAAKALFTLLSITVVGFMMNAMMSSSILKIRHNIRTISIKTNTESKPYHEYTDEVDFRVIVITYDRATSVMKLLNSLNDLELDGDRAALEIWIDIHKDGTAHAETVQAVRSFKWTKGPTRVHVQTSHAGIAGQWIDTWRPKPNSRELAIILEDDLSVSPMAYRFVKGVHRAMANATNFVGVTIQSDELMVLSNAPQRQLAASKNDTIFMYKCFGTWGFSPKPDHWRRFQVDFDIFQLA